ncbi:hypothetical protein ACG33_00830 [Steroidobacter denitrificans]|uniref:PEGA domain-containing protein n=1 Tax=Steroidobacter denitrificans TaxID=465721 RepID=A0A127F5F2_STEDE|nr:SUMF1/EgtB/PvdO family nonheme iron enzyme [Steroidobacter denitrificans]AMN45672.1 hypothetical protein ACG33_00830 [Steroidobacter denitrificans]
MSGLIVREALGERRFATADFPISVGGPGSTILVGGCLPGVHAYIGLHEEQLFVQPAEDAEVLLNGLRLTSSSWLRSGDVVNLGPSRLCIARQDGRFGEDFVARVDDGSSGNITAPPIIAAGAGIHGENDGESERIDIVDFRRSDADSTPRRFLVSPARAMMGIAAIVVAAALWFMFTAVSISVVTDPAQARLDLDGPAPIVRFGGHVLLRSGSYRIRAQQDGYASAHIDVTVTKEPNQRFRLELAKLPGRLQIDVPVSAKIEVDGKEQGVAPGEFELAAGRHTVSITAPRYRPFSDTLEIEGGGKTQVFSPQLEPDWALVEVKSAPPGAEVRVDGRRVGVTPLRTEILAGSHPLELRLAGFKSWTTDVQIEAGQPVSLGPITLGLPDGRLMLHSEPAGAGVSVAGVYRGQTPLQLELRPELPHTIVLTRPGYASASRQLSLRAGESRSLSIPLEGVFGEIELHAQPSDAQLYVDGEARGAANQTLRLVATTHEIVIRKAGFVDFKTSVTPRPGMRQIVEAKLPTVEQSRLAATPATVQTKDGLQLRRMPIGRFTMGSSRREPGRRANEAQREVEFKRSYYISVTEVTNAQFRRFRSSHRSGVIGQHTLDLDNQPVVGVSWGDAAQYCNWLSQQEGLSPAYESKGGRLVGVEPMTTGYRLPTDAEWEWAARYETATRLRRYPWGDTLPVVPRSGNYADATARLILQDVIPEYDDGFAASAPVGRFPPNPLGLHDMGGNVAEWVHDLYTVGLSTSQPAVDPMGPAEGRQHVIRGSSWRHSSVTDLRLSARDFGDAARNDIGFRIARYAQ